ncbi:hypothetical protein HRG_009326 [Hirsutella rhossiliensis]|uniref:Uncharacterized protein n=1 Tax=Hirsutella rhossiliensis TaxID=111463 RepID=A0A9P8MQX9_9HYPO|nr:uncharacterized protein HRG_09326 [Hirsutella rhossiliensis]KAH0959544.1 hypothetical protein HRG_09326 [Hirsutella rhossiliensis]
MVERALLRGGPGFGFGPDARDPSVVQDERYVRDGRAATVQGPKGIGLAARALNSPRLLELPGISGATHLNGDSAQGGFAGTYADLVPSPGQYAMVYSFIARAITYPLPRAQYSVES